MKIFLKVLATSLLATAAYAQRPDMIFIPVGLYYVDGAFANATVITKDGKLPTFDSVNECIDFLRNALTAAAKQGALSDGHGAIGGCIPVHRLMTPAT